MLGFNIIVGGVLGPTCAEPIILSWSSRYSVVFGTCAYVSVESRVSALVMVRGMCTFGVALGGWGVASSCADWGLHMSNSWGNQRLNCHLWQYFSSAPMGQSGHRFDHLVCVSQYLPARRPGRNHRLMHCCSCL